MWHTSESAERRPTPEEPTSSRLPPGLESTRSMRTQASSASGKSTSESTFISRSYCLRPCATTFEKSAIGARRSVSVRSGEAPARSASPPSSAE